MEKRARTRISDEQLKILRQYFDINNSPSEEAILEMASKTHLPPKVIKHWFRNTLFKVRFDTDCGFHCGSSFPDPTAINE